MTADQARLLCETMTGVIEQEAVATRKVVKAITNRDYKPDPKSRSAWELATHLATSDVWFADSILKGAFAWHGEPPLPAEMKDPAGVAKWHEQHLGDRLTKLRAMTSDQLLRGVDFFGRQAPAVTWLNRRLSWISSNEATSCQSLSRSVSLLRIRSGNDKKERIRPP